MVIPVFHAQVNERGLLEFPQAEQVLRKQWLATLTGRRVEVIVRKERVQRSDDQNKYLHAVPFPLLAECWGEDIETTKLLVLGECFGWRDTRDGHRMPMKPSTSRLTVEEGSHLIEWIPPWAMVNFGVDIPLPKKATGA